MASHWLNKGMSQTPISYSEDQAQAERDQGDGLRARAEGRRGVFRGDHVHAGMCGTGCALFRIRACCADVAYKKDVVPDADRVCFMTKG